MKPRKPVRLARGAAGAPDSPSEALEEAEVIANEVVAPPGAIPSVTRGYEKQGWPPAQAHECYVGCPCINTTPKRMLGRLKHQEKLARRAARVRGVHHG